MVLLNSLFREPLYFAVLGLAFGFSANSPPHSGLVVPPSHLAAVLRRNLQSLNRRIEAVLQRHSPGHIIVLTAALLAVIQFAINRSLWMDEAKLALNIISLGNAGLLQPLNYLQVAPIGFVQVTKLFSYLTPNAEYGPRLFPLLCYLGALFFFNKTARMLFKDALPYTAVVALFAFNTTLFYFAGELKQYMTDVLVAVVMLYLALKPHPVIRKKYLVLAAAQQYPFFHHEFAYYTQTGYFVPECLRVIQGGHVTETGEAFYEAYSEHFTGATWILFSHDMEKAGAIILHLEEMYGHRPERVHRARGAVVGLYIFGE